jgi:hypothetical protein
MEEIAMLLFYLPIIIFEAMFELNVRREREQAQGGRVHAD